MSHRWGIVLGGTGLLGAGWFTQSHTWPMLFSTRKQARNEARHLTAKYAYLDPVHHGWKFWAVKVLFTVEGRER